MKPNRFPFTDAYRQFIERHRNEFFPQIRKRLMQAFGLKANQANSVCQQWVDEQTVIGADVQPDPPGEVKADLVTFIDFDPPVVQCDPKADAERFRLIAGEHAISEEEQRLRRLFHE